MKTNTFVGLRGLLLASCLLIACGGAANESPVFKIYLERDGAYQLSFEDLVVAGLEAGTLDSSRLALENQGESVPIWVEDGGDGVFGPGDRLEFVGEHLAGDASFVSEYTRYNVYSLRLAKTHAERMAPSGEVSETDRRGFHTFLTEQHLEQDVLLPRLPPSKGSELDEHWYWAKLTHIDKEPSSRISTSRISPTVAPWTFACIFGGGRNPDAKARLRCLITVWT